MYKARCLRNCTFRGRFWREGQVYEGAETPPAHFELLREAVAPEADTGTPTPEPATETEEQSKPKKRRKNSDGE